MPRATYIDANIPIYAAGSEHPYREPCIRVLAAVNDNPEVFVTDAEVFQGVRHHYLRTERWEACQLTKEHRSLNSRDLLHLAVMYRLGVTGIVTADADFGRPGFLDPGVFDNDNGRPRAWPCLPPLPAQGRVNQMTPRRSTSSE